MSSRTIQVTDAIHAYLIETTVRETDAMRELRGSPIWNPIREAHDGG